MENTLERIAKCRYRTKMDERSGFWRVDLISAAQELLAFITRKGRVFKCKVMPFGVANAPALLQELMNKILYLLRRRPLVQELISRGAEMEAHIDDVSLGTNTQEDHVLLLREFFIVCQENHLRIKLEKCESMKEEMEYLGFDQGPKRRRIYTPNVFIRVLYRENTIRYVPSGVAADWRQTHVPPQSKQTLPRIDGANVRYFMEFAMNLI